MASPSGEEEESMMMEGIGIIPFEDNSRRTSYSVGGSVERA